MKMIKITNPIYIHKPSGKRILLNRHPSIVEMIRNEPIVCRTEDGHAEMITRFNNIEDTGETDSITVPYDFLLSEARKKAPEGREEEYIGFFFAHVDVEIFEGEQ